MKTKQQIVEEKEKLCTRLGMLQYQMKALTNRFNGEVEQIWTQMKELEGDWELADKFEKAQAEQAAAAPPAQRDVPYLDARDKNTDQG